MVKPITKYITDDGLIFDTIESAEQSERDHANFKLYIQKFKNDKCNPIRLPLNSNLSECISIDNDIIFFDSLCDAKALLALERDYRNNCNMDFSNGINWEGPGYYYASTDKYDDQNIWYKYYKTYRLFIPDAEKMLADFSNMLDNVKRTEELMKAGLQDD